MREPEPEPEPPEPAQAAPEAAPAPAEDEARPPAADGSAAAEGEPVTGADHGSPDADAEQAQPSAPPASFALELGRGTPKPVETADARTLRDMVVEVVVNADGSVRSVDILQTSGSDVADDSMKRYFEFMPYTPTGQAYVEVLRVVLVRRDGASVEYLPSPQVEVLERRNL